ncbi:MAG: VanW family protein [Clostridia bacterium]|nr:VanW family protein [Clostridia bacterium]
MIKKIIKKLNCLVYMLALTASVIIFQCGFFAPKKLPQGVVVNGTEVGGLTISKAAETLRGNIESELKTKSLKIVADGYVYKFCYPEIYYTDNIYSVLKYAQKNQSYTAEISYYLCGLDEIATGICLSFAKNAVEPYAEFSKFQQPFKYFEGSDGKEVDRAKLIDDVNKSLCGNFEDVKLKFNSIKRQKTLDEVKKKTRLLQSFTTYFDGTNINRSSNIRLAAAKLNGTVIEAGKTLSFNDIVGARVKERGFLPAKIIENGEFTEGVGGGVCQVSTTLYNAAILSGLEIKEYHPHSLAVGYVAPSRDAMVSGSACDLKITNNRTCPVYIRAHTSNGSVTFDIYGESDGKSYSFISSVTGSVPAPEETTDDPLKARDGKDGILSEGYLEVTQNGYKKTVKLRKDKYQPVKKVIFETTEEPAQNIEP